MLRGQISLGRLFGIPVRADYSWVLIFIWVTWSLSAGFFPQQYPEATVPIYVGLGLLTSLLFFGSVLLHELGHSLVARRHGVPVHDITLFIFGGVAQIGDEPRTPREEALIALVGPGVSLGLAGLFGLAFLAVRDVLPAFGSLTLFLAGINLSLGVFNLIPGFPLDGGRVLRAVLWGMRRDLTWATRWASRVGQVVAFGFVLLGIVRAFTGDWLGGLWIAFIGFFLDSAARSSYMQLTLRNLLDGHVVREAMTQDCPVLPPQLTLDVLVDNYLMGSGRRCFTVGSRDSVVGLLTIHNVRQVPKDRWPNTQVRDALTPLDDLRAVRPNTALWEAMQLMTAEGVNQLPVLENGELVGMLTRENLLTFIRNRAELEL